MRYTEYFKQPSPELGELADITVVTDAILAGEKNQSGKIEFLKATNSGNTINLVSQSRTSKNVKHYNGMSVSFYAPIAMSQSDTAYQLKVDNLPAQPFKVKTQVRASELVTAIFDSVNGFVSTNSPIPRSSATNSNSEITVATSKAVNDLRANLTGKSVIAGNGLIGGGTLSNDVTLNVVSANDGITVNADNIQLNAVNNLVTKSATKPLSANQGVVIKELIDTKANKSTNIVAGKGLTGGGNLNNNVTLNVSSENDGIIVKDDNIYLNVVNDLKTKSTTRALSASMGIELLNTIDPYTTQFNKKQILYNFNSLSVDVYHDNSSPELDFYLTYKDNDKLKIDERIVRTTHQYKEASSRLYQDSIKGITKNDSLRITVIHNFNLPNPQLTQSLGGRK